MSNPNVFDRVGLAGAENVQGEEQKKLDVLSDEIMVNALRASGKCNVLVTEERVSGRDFADRGQSKRGL